MWKNVFFFKRGKWHIFITSNLYNCTNYACSTRCACLYIVVLQRNATSIDSRATPSLHSILKSALWSAARVLEDSAVLISEMGVRGFAPRFKTSILPLKIWKYKSHLVFVFFIAQSVRKVTTKKKNAGWLQPLHFFIGGETSFLTIEISASKNCHPLQTM